MNMPFLLQHGSNVPMHQQLREQIISAIENGRLAPGQKMPSSRALSREMRVSRIVIVQCYETLTSMGYLAAKVGSGSYVRRNISAPHRAVPMQCKEPFLSIPENSDFQQRKILSSQFSSALKECTQIDSGAIDLSELNYGAPPPHHLPTKVWRRILLGLLQREDKVQYDDHCFGSMELRESLCSYVRRARGVNCSPAQIAVFTSSQISLSILLRLMLDKGDFVAVENPGFGHARKLVSFTGAELIPIGLDEEGMRIDVLRQLQIKPKLIYVTPSHHDPTGMVMSLKRRQEILDWAQENNIVIIEDDYDSEYRYGSQLLPSIQSLDKDGHVIYLANFWKVLFPFVTMGYLVLPAHLVGPMEKSKAFTDRVLPFLEQRALAKFVSSGALENHIHKKKQAYTQQRQELIFALNRTFGKKIRLARESAGMHLLFSLESDLRAETIVQLAQHAGISMASTQNYYFSSRRPGEFLISFADLNPGDIGPKIFVFAAGVKQAEQENIAELLDSKIKNAQTAIFSHSIAAGHTSIAYKY